MMKEKKCVYKITKKGRNFEDVYYIRIFPKNLVNENVLENIGEHTDGGHEYGYSMKARKIKKLPKGQKFLSQTHRIY